MEENKNFGLFFIQKPTGITKFQFLLVAFLIGEGARLYLVKLLGGYYTMILIGFILLSLPLSVINVRIVRLDKDIIYANLAGCIMPLAAASYFGALLITKLNLLVVIGSLAIASFVQIKRTKVFSGGSGGIILFITIAAVTLAIIAPFSPSPGDKLILLRLFFVYMLAVCATIISDLFQINKRRKDPRPCVSLVGGNGIFDGIWIGGYMTAMVLLILHYDGYLDLGQQFFTWRGF